MRDHLAANHWRGNLTYGLFASNESKSGSNNSFKRFTRNKNDLYRLDRPPKLATSSPQHPGRSCARRSAGGGGGGGGGDDKDRTRPTTAQRGGPAVRLRCVDSGRPLKSDSERGFHRAEHLQQIPQDTLSHQLVYPYRADSESVHSQFDLSLWNRRMIAYGVERQKVFVLGFALSQNATSHQLHLSKAA
ncbi:hypothetical protein [Streptomyces virginiae]|uniref:hypothetical protein n=1 Tax=Streptomyces virginiae TaxID=1961 RepID=UPI00386C89D8|nr:hypothetical protein OG253_23510 [Streptomyces virginiae]